MGARACAWIGGALFVASLAVCVWSYAVTMGGHAPFAGWRPLLVDASLVTVFACHHSLFARERVKAWLSRSVPAATLRSVYVWVASLLLIVVCRLWVPIGGELYSTTGISAVALVAAQLSGVWIAALGVARIDPLELAGIRQAARVQTLQVTGPYRWVRHPLYLGWFLMVFGAVRMTGDRLAFAVVTTLYLVVAIPWEERSLRQSFGEAYAAYMRDVRWRMVPFIY